MFLKRTPLLFVLLLIAGQCIAQQVHINGNITDTLQNPIGISIISIKSTSSAFFNMNNGVFDFYADAKDTVLFTARGYRVRKYPVSYFKNGPQNVVLKELYVNLPVASVTATKTAGEIREEINKLELKPTDTYKSVNAIESPITFLYEMFNKNERSKREVALLEFNDARKKVLKDITRVLMQYDVVAIDEKDLNDFVETLSISAAWMKTSTDYDVALAIKQQYDHHWVYHHSK